MQTKKGLVSIGQTVAVWLKKQFPGWKKPSSPSQLYLKKVWPSTAIWFRLIMHDILHICLCIDLWKASDSFGLQFFESFAFFGVIAGSRSYIRSRRLIIIRQTLHISPKISRDSTTKIRIKIFVGISIKW